jgi:hypothetical protein
VAGGKGICKGEGINEESEGEYGWCIFYTYMNDETCRSHFKNGEREEEEEEEWRGWTKLGIQCTHIWKCHNDTPWTTIIC